MHPPVIAERLRGRGHDALAVVEAAGGLGLNDDEVCASAVAARRAVVTENASDFLRVAAHRGAAGEAMPTLIITANRSFPRHHRTFIGRAGRALAEFCVEHPEDDLQAGAVFWLRPVS